MSRIGIVDAVLICSKCGQKIKMKHLKCQKEKRQELILEILNDLKSIKNPWGLLDYDDTWDKIKEKWEKKSK